MAPRGSDARHRIAKFDMPGFGGARTHYAYDAMGAPQRRVKLHVTSFIRLRGGQSRCGLYAHHRQRDGHQARRGARGAPPRKRRVRVKTVGGVACSAFDYAHGILGCATNRNADSFAYNERSEVVAEPLILGGGATLGKHYSYDNIGNMTNLPGKSADALNRYAGAGMAYDADGNLTADGVHTFRWDAQNRLSAVFNGASCAVSNAYDHAGRRVLKQAGGALSYTYIYDGWNPAAEIVQSDSIPDTAHTNLFICGKDISGAAQSAGGVGGLLAARMDGEWFFPLYDANGNITEYLDADGAAAASRRYDAFGADTYSSGAAAFRHWFSTKQHDSETGLYYYGFRFHSPALRRWLNRDTIEENGGINLYAFCANDGVNKWDLLGRDVYLTEGNRNAGLNFINRYVHQEICVDIWMKSPHGCGVFIKADRLCVSFAATGVGFVTPSPEWLGEPSPQGGGPIIGEVYETDDQGTKTLKTLKTTPLQDMAFLAQLLELLGQRATYSVLRHNCRTFSQMMYENAVLQFGGRNNTSTGKICSLCEKECLE